MKVNSQGDIPFKSVYTNRFIKKGLEFASSNGALFGATATVAFSAFRPVSILLTPNTEKENRKIAAAKSITSSIINFLLMLCISVPLAKSIKKIDENPTKYLKQESIKILKNNSDNLINSKGYEFATQLFKLGIAAVIAAPKAIMTAKGLPYIVDTMNRENDGKKTKYPVFKGTVTEAASTGIGKIINNKKILKFIDKFKDTNFPMHITAITDTVATLVFMHQAANNNKIDEKRKNTLICNSGISTALCITGGYTVDKMIEKPVEKFINKYKIINKNDKNLSKQIQGIKIAKPFLILGTIYYIFIPLISTFLAERADVTKYNKHSK